LEWWPLEVRQRHELTFGKVLRGYGRNLKTICCTKKHVYERQLRDGYKPAAFILEDKSKRRHVVAWPRDFEVRWGDDPARGEFDIPFYDVPWVKCQSLRQFCDGLKEGHKHQEGWPAPPPDLGTR
jgi:hypothetical protein